MDKANSKLKEGVTHTGTSQEEMETDEDLGNFIEKTFLDLEKIDDFLYRSKSLWQGKNARGVFGGLVIGQALVAASECLPPDFHMHSMHSYFLRPGSKDRPILYRVDVTREGRTYCSTAVKAIQANKAIFTMQASFKREEENHSNYQIPMPKVPFPEELSSPEESLKKLRDQDLISPLRYNYRKEQLSAIPIQVKYIKEEQVVYRTTQRQTVWLKVKGHLPDDLHSNIHKCCLGYMSDMYLLSTASVPLRWLHKVDTFAASVDHAMWFHAPFRADEWMLFDVQIDSIGDGRTLLVGRVWDLKGSLVSTVTQEGVLRLQPGKKPKL